MMDTLPMMRAVPAVVAIWVKETTMMTVEETVEVMEAVTEEKMASVSKSIHAVFCTASTCTYSIVHLFLCISLWFAAVV
jgi:hypothetical protein